MSDRTALMNHQRRKARVLFSFARPDSTSSPYARRLVESLGDSVDIRFFSWKTLLSPWPDILHLHWPDATVRHQSAVRSQLRGALGLLFLAIRRPLGIRVVWTIHNVEPHEGLTGLAQAFVSRVQKSCDHRIYINASPENEMPDSTTILHGPLAVSSATATRTSPPSPRVLFFGMVRPYKGIEHLIAAFREDPALPMELLIVGQPFDADYAGTIKALADADPRIDFVPEFIDDLELEQLIMSSRLVVLPYHSVYNSGALLLAVELDIHVLVPRTVATAQLQDEFGAERLSLFDPTLRPDDLRSAIEKSSGQPRQRPSFESRAWESCASAHERVYASVLSL